MLDSQRLRLFFEKLCVQVNGCVTWTGATSKDGYGYFWNGEKPVGAHVFWYELVNGPVPDELELDHTCEAKSCVVHTEAVTHHENILRGNTGRWLRTEYKTICVNGHQLAGENLVVHRHGSLPPSYDCRQCKNDRARRYRGQNN